ncbi:MAG: dTDP-4-dehydrorhamnose 3,5-epimerase [Nitrospirae bacterium]|nr:dTDP-4-dehydrorhamnose 3,5-epimerase [Nitrospirota bacterium]
MPFNFTRLSIPDIVLIEPRAFRDGRGFFIETYKYSEFAFAGISGHFLQDNHSQSSKGVLRGLHYQLNPKAQGKLLRCPKGKIFDVAVDIRRGSPDYGKWVGIELSEENNSMLYIPPGFAHGFLTLSDMADVLYKCTEEYSPEHERGIAWNDPEVNIDWPIKTPILSAKDLSYGTLKDADNNFRRE